MIPQAKSFFAVRKIPGKKKCVVTGSAADCITPPRIPWLVAIWGAVLQKCVKCVTEP